MLVAIDKAVTRWLRIESFRQVVVYSLICAVVTTIVPMSVVAGALWRAPKFAFYMGVGIAGFIPVIITIPVAFVIFYMLLLIARTVDQVGAVIKFAPLTGVLTRAHFLAEAQRCYSRGGVFMMVDADHFKMINDSFGHDIGDAALKTLATALATCVGDNGFVGRLGGEEFGVFLPCANAPMASLMAQTIATGVRGNGREIEGHKIGLTVSIGAATKITGRSLDEAIKAADKLLYAAKRAGRDCAYIEGVTFTELHSCVVA